MSAGTEATRVRPLAVRAMEDSREDQRWSHCHGRDHANFL